MMKGKDIVSAGWRRPSRVFFSFFANGQLPLGKKIIADEFLRIRASRRPASQPGSQLVLKCKRNVSLGRQEDD